MDRNLVRRQLEKILARQSHLSEKTKTLVRDRLENLDWDDFTSSVMEDYFQRVGTSDKVLSPAECNQLLMDAIQEQIGKVFVSAE